MFWYMLEKYRKSKIFPNNQIRPEVFLRTYFCEKAAGRYCGPLLKHYAACHESPVALSAKSSAASDFSTASFYR